MSHPLNRHTCEEAFRRLDDYLDRRLGPDDMRQIEEHLSICAACTREFAFEASVLEGVKHKLRQLSAPPDLLSRILGQLPGSDREGGSPDH
jgi:anti-sigma factor (TIGR02949 family)